VISACAERRLQAIGRLALRWRQNACVDICRDRQPRMPQCSGDDLNGTPPPASPLRLNAEGCGTLALELPRFPGHPILGVVEGEETRGGSSSEVPRGVPA